MQPRLDFYGLTPDVLRKTAELNIAINNCGLEVGLLHLIKLRASQINGCSYCVEAAEAA